MEEMDDENVHLDQSLKKIEFLTKLSGINIRSGEISSKEKIKYRIIYLVNYIWLNIDLAGGIYWFIDGMINGKDFLGLTYIAPCILFTSLANIKGLFLILNKDAAFKLIENLRNLEKKELRVQSRGKDEILQREKHFLHVVINVVNCLYIIVMIFFASSPLVLIFLNYHKTGELELILPFLILYPFDPYNPKIWPFVYLHQLWSQAIVYFDIGFADLFFFTCCTYIRIQFKFLQYKIENLIPVQKSNGLFVDDDDFKEKFRNIVKWHQEIIESANILEGIYSMSTLLNFISSSTVICLTGFNVTMANNMTIVLTFISFLSMSLFQVFFLCFFADLMMTAAHEVTRYLRKVPMNYNLAKKPRHFTLNEFCTNSYNAYISRNVSICTLRDVDIIIKSRIFYIFISFLSMSLFQVLFLCFFADLKMTASMEIADAVYKSRWHMAEASVGKKLLIILIRGQKPCRLTAFGFADVNLNSFMRVLSTAWSYFALLQTLYGGSD